jgi:hypothetical protein
MKRETYNSFMHLVWQLKKLSIDFAVVEILHTNGKGLLIEDSESEHCMGVAGRIDTTGPDEITAAV